MARVHRSYPAPRRSPEWSGLMVRSVNEGQGTTQSLGSVVAVGIAALVNQTIVRLRGSVHVRFIPGAVDDAQVLGCGLMLVNSDAFVAGSASVPSPVEDLDAAWIWHHLFTLAPALEATGSDDSLALWHTIEIDSKAQRKFKPNETLCFMWDSLQLAGTPTADGTAAIRTLVLLT